MNRIAFLLVLCSAPGAVGQQPARCLEPFAPGYQYHVSCRVNISGTLQVPQEKGPAKQLTVAGTSAIEYDERILAEKSGKVDKTIRNYRKMDFERKVGDQEQRIALRAEVRRMVILRNNHLEVPFSPGGPMTWGELDLVRTDVFTPALAGLLSSSQVKIGDRWQADVAAVKELTDMDRIEDGSLSCVLESIATLVGRQQARVSFQGTVRGIGEDGPARHQLEGHLFFDLVSNHLSYLYVKGTHFLLDKSGQDKGKVEGTFVLTREPVSQARDLADADLRGLVLEPSEENTLLLHDNPTLGIRFLYSRRWRVAGTSGRQVALDEKGGSGLLITLEPTNKTPTAAQFHQEARNWLNQNKAGVYRMDQPKSVAQGVENFAADVDLAKQRLLLDYYVVRQSYGGATVAARVLPTDTAAMRKEIEAIVRSIRITRQQ